MGCGSTKHVSTENAHPQQGTASNAHASNQGRVRSLALAAVQDPDIRLAARNAAETLGDEVFAGAADLVKLDIPVAEVVQVARDVCHDVLERVDDVAAFGLELLEAMEAAPMVGPLFKLLTLAAARARDVQVNRHNCQVLSKVLVRTAMFLKGAVQQDKSTGYIYLKAHGDTLKSLQEGVALAERLLARYAGSDTGAWLLMVLSAKRDVKRFKEVRQLLLADLDHLQSAAVLQLAQQQPQRASVADELFKDDMSKAAQEVLKQAGLASDGDVAEGLRILSRSTESAGRRAVANLLVGSPGDEAVLRTLASSEQLLAGLSEKVDAVLKEVGFVAVLVQGLDVKVDVLLTKFSALEQFALNAVKQTSDTKGSVLAQYGYIMDFWKTSSIDGKGRVKSTAFVRALLDWFTAKGKRSMLLAYDEQLLEEGVVASLATESGAAFLEILLELCPDSSMAGIVKRSTLFQLHVIGLEYAQKEQIEEPIDSLEALLDAIYVGFDRGQYAQRTRVQPASQGVLAQITSALKVLAVIDSYNIPMLLETYWPGSRMWMYKKVTAWLDRTISDDQEASRIFLMLADPGMGKSVFSAVMATKLVVQANLEKRLVVVRHFFKVGEPRAKGKAMVLCIAQQLAEDLPGFAPLLLGAVQQNSDASQLSLVETFDKFLKEPLWGLDASAAAGARQLPTAVLLLLDALDESDDEGKGWAPVTRLIANEFVKLPPWIKVMLTSRPEVQQHFVRWAPAWEWIKPDGEQNMQDMLELLIGRLEASGYVAASDVTAAAQLMQGKSKGQFIYVKYAFEVLTLKERWTLADLDAQLPLGLGSMFMRVMLELDQAVRKDGRDDLLKLLHRKLLPVLVMSRELLTVDELVAAMGEQVNQAQLLLLLSALRNLFPRVVANDGEGRDIFRPYHKSVLDWFKGESGMDAGKFKVDQGAGNRLLAQASNAWLQKHVPQPWLSEPTAPPTSVQPASASGGNAGHMYALRHALAHACQADDAPLLKTILYNIGMWQATFAAGFGPLVVGDLLELADKAPPAATAVVRDMLRWLRNCCAYLVKHPRAAWQLACDTPRNSLLAVHTSSQAVQPPVRLLTKEDQWSACLASLKGHTSLVSSVAISPDGKTVVSGSYDNTVRVWDLATGQCTNTLEGHTDPVSSLAIRRTDGKTVVSGSHDNTLRVWDLATGQCTNTLEEHTSSVFGVAISPDGKTVVSGSGYTVRVWDLATGQCTNTLEGRTSWVYSVAISPDGKTVMSESNDNTIRPNLLCRGHNDTDGPVTLHPDDESLASNRPTRLVDTMLMLSCYVTQPS